MAEDAFVTDFEHIMADDITENVRFIMYDSESGKTASAGEVSKYMMKNVHVDPTLTEEGAAAEAKAVGEALATKADTKGRYEDIVAGGAEQLMADGYETDKEPYLFRTTGGSSDAGNREYVDKIVGGTVGWNQLIENGDFADVSWWQTSKASYTVSNNVATMRATAKGSSLYSTFFDTVANNHVYLATVSIKTSASAGGVRFRLNGGYKDMNSVASSDWQVLQGLYKYTVVDNRYLQVMDMRTSGWDDILIKDAMVIDLTALFNPTIADYIYSLEQSQAGAGVAWFRNYFSKDYYPYDPGTLRSVEGVSAHEMVGFNQFDKSTAVNGYIDNDNGQVSGSSPYKSTDYIKIVPNTSYYFKTEQTSAFWGAWYDADKNYISSLTAYQNTVKTAPSNAHYVRATIASSQSGNIDTFCINLSDPTRNGEYEPYQKHTYLLDSSLTLRGVPRLADGKLAFDGDVYPPSGEVQRRYGLRAYQSGDESLADAITDGTNTVYKLSTPTTETADAYEQYQICDPSGTEEFVTTSIVPVGHETRYPHDLKKKIETAPDSPSTDGTYLMKRSGGKNAYMALPSTPSANGAYVLTVTVSGGSASYSWTKKE